MTMGPPIEIRLSEVNMSGPFMPPQQQMKPKPIMDRMPQGGPVTRGNTGYGQIAAGKKLGVDPSTLRQAPGAPQASSTPRPQAVPTRTPATPQPQPNPNPQAPPAAPPPAAGGGPPTAANLDQRIVSAGLRPPVPMPMPKPADLAAQVPTQDLDARIAQAANQMQGKRNAFPGVGGPTPAAPVPAPTLPTPAPPAQPGVGATIYDMLSSLMPGMGNKAAASLPAAVPIPRADPATWAAVHGAGPAAMPTQFPAPLPGANPQAVVPPLVAAVAAANKAKDPSTLPEVERPSGPPVATKVTTPSFGGYYQEPPKPKKGEAQGEKAPNPQKTKDNSFYYNLKLGVPIGVDGRAVAAALYQLQKKAAEDPRKITPAEDQILASSGDTEAYNKSMLPADVAERFKQYARGPKDQPKLPERIGPADNAPVQRLPDPTQPKPVTKFQSKIPQPDEAEDMVSKAVSGDLEQ